MNGFNKLANIQFEIINKIKLNDLFWTKFSSMNEKNEIICMSVWKQLKRSLRSLLAYNIKPFEKFKISQELTTDRIA